jgi:hypothetical protein
MPTSNPWIVCEKSGRWAAALRVALGRDRAISLAPRILEVRNLAEFDAAMHNQKAPLGFVEVRPDNLGAVLELLTNSSLQNVRYVVLLDDALTGHPLVADVLWEAGAAEVIDSPRRMHPALKFAERTAAVQTTLSAHTNELESIAERAWAALPWQDG